VNPHPDFQNYPKVILFLVQNNYFEDGEQKSSKQNLHLYFQRDYLVRHARFITWIVNCIIVLKR